MRRVFLSLLSLMLSSCMQASPEDRLSKIETDLERDFPRISHVKPDELASRIAQYQTERVDVRREGVILFDVREPEEFAVGHLPGAIRIDPNARGQDVLATLKSEAAEDCPQVVFYCSVGVRSSVLAERARVALQAAGCPLPENLRGGVFAWHNQKRVLENAEGPTDFVHPYDRSWGRLLIRQDAVMLPVQERKAG
jgi:rhodanese-related sulfurtransferase